MVLARIPFARPQHTPSAYRTFPMKEMRFHLHVQLPVGEDETRMERLSVDVRHFHLLGSAFFKQLPDKVIRHGHAMDALADGEAAAILAFLFITTIPV